MATSIYTSKKFNLVPPKTKEEVRIVEERDNSLYYSFILIFFGLVIFFVITLADVLVVKPREVLLSSAIAQKDEEIDAYNSIKGVYGELFTKARTLEPILDQDIKLSQLLEISEDIIEGIPNAQILSYSRATNGDFTISLTLSSFEDIDNVVENANSIEVLENLFVRNLAKSTDTIYTAEISFTITNILSKTDA